MNVNDKAREKLLMLGELSVTERKKSSSKIYSTLSVFYKTLIEKYFCSVLQSLKF